MGVLATFAAPAHMNYGWSKWMGDRDSRCALCGQDTNIDGVVACYDGGGSHRLASGGAMKLKPGGLGDGGGESDRTRCSLSIDVDMRV